MSATKDGIAEFGFIPCYINRKGAPEPLTSYEQAKEVMNYVRPISKEEGLSIQMA